LALNCDVLLVPLHLDVVFDQLRVAGSTQDTARSTEQAANNTFLLTRRLLDSADPVCFLIVNCRRLRSSLDLT
jgi:hypothetical protein